MSERTRVPAISSLEDAVRIFYENLELRTATIRELFPGISQSKVSRLKNMAREEMKNREVDTFDSTAVNTRCAYAAWGLDVAELEYRLQKVRRLKLEGGKQA